MEGKRWRAPGGVGEEGKECACVMYFSKMQLHAHIYASVFRSERKADLLPQNDKPYEN
jgi:hypothetical protein